MAAIIVRDEWEFTCIHDAYSKTPAVINTQAIKKNIGIINLRSLIWNISQQRKIPPRNKNSSPIKQRINVVPTKRDKHWTVPVVEQK
jgi:hypothetical protein